MADEKEPEPGEIIKSDAPKPDGLKKDEVFDPARTPEDEEHAKRMKDLFGDLGDDEDEPETIDDVRAERNELAEQVERLKASVARTRKENSALLQKVNEGKDAIAAVDTLRAQDKKEGAVAFVSDLAPVAASLAAGLKEIDAQERAANPKLDKLTVGVENTLTQLTNVFNKYGVKLTGETPAPAPAKDATPPAPATPDATAPETPANTTPDVPVTPPAAPETPVPPATVETIESLRVERDALRAAVSQLGSSVGKGQSDNLTLNRRIEEGKALLTRELAKREENKQFTVEKPLKDLMPVIDTLETGLAFINAKARAETPILTRLPRSSKARLRMCAPFSTNTASRRSTRSTSLSTRKSTKPSPCSPAKASSP